MKQARYIPPRGRAGVNGGGGGVLPSPSVNPCQQPTTQQFGCPVGAGPGATGYPAPDDFCSQARYTRLRSSRSGEYFIVGSYLPWR